MDTTREDYKAKMDAQLKIWSARLDGFKADARKSSAEAKIELSRRLAELKVFETAAKKHIALVDNAAIENWSSMRVGIEHAWDRLSGSVEALWDAIMPAATPKN